MCFIKPKILGMAWYGLVWCELCEILCCCLAWLHLKQNPDNRLETLESNCIVALVGASPVSKPYRVLDLQI